MAWWATELKRGEVWWVDLDPTRGGEIQKVKIETEFSQLLHIPFHRSPAEAIRLHHPDEPEGNAMDTR